MGVASLTRSVRFRARHRYWRASRTAEENRGEFGAQSAFHEHEFRVDVTVRGEMAPTTGFVVRLRELDGALEDLVARVRGQDLSAIPSMDDSEALPSTENLAKWFWEGLIAGLPGDVSLQRVRVAEGEELAADYYGPGH